MDQKGVVIWRTIVVLLVFATFGSGCAKKRFLYYKPNAPLWPGQNSPQQGQAPAPLFNATIGIIPLRDLTDYEAAYEPALPARTLRFNLAKASAGRWPLLSAALLSQAMSQEFTADGLAAGAALDDDEWAALSDHARILISGNLDEADVAKTQDGPGHFILRLDVQAAARAANGADFDEQIIDQSYSEEATSDASGAAAAANQAINRLLAHAAKDMAKVLQGPALQAQLNWSQAEQSQDSDSQDSGDGN